MNWLDLIIALALIGFISYGSMTGFVRMVTTVIAMIVSVLVTLQVYLHAVFLIFPVDMAGKFGTQMFVFFLILVFVTKLVGLVVTAVDKVFKVLSAIPFAKTINRSLGALLGFILGIVTVAGVLYAASQLQTIPLYLSELMDGSIVSRALLFAAGIIALFFPAIWGWLQSLLSQQA